MNKGRETSFNFNNFPKVDDKEGWQKYAEETASFVNEYAQTGKIYQTFGGNIATSALRGFLDRSTRIKRLQDLNAPNIILENDIKKLNNLFNEFGKIDHEAIADLRAILANLPVSHRHIQNQIFTNLMNRYRSKYILETLKPDRMTKKGTETPDGRFLGFMMGLSSDKMMWYDFIGKLTELDTDGQPTISDDSFQNFFEWYQTSLAKLQHKLNADKPADIANYSDLLRNAVSHKLLPEIFTKNLDFFKPNSPKSRNLNFSLFDMMGIGSSALGIYNECWLTDREAPIGVRADVAVDNDIYMVVWHELTHAISGDMIDFGDNEANRIVDEALTEHISHLILMSSDDMWDDEEYEFMSGNSYTKERSVVGWLAFGGAKIIPPKIFYEAYAEYDTEYEKTIDNWCYTEGKEVPKPKIGPKKEVLFSALLEAFPDCKDTSDLGILILEKFKEKTPQYN